MSTLPRQVTEPARTIDVIHETDVLVVGSGPGGLGAALGAARAGARTTLVERHGCFGGNITAVGVETFAWYRRPETVDSVGVGAEIEARARAAGATTDESQSTSQALDADRFKVVADALVEENGIHPMLHRMFTAPIVEGGVLRGVITESKSGREAILAKRVVDATGDADVAARSGAVVHMAPPEERLSVSVLFSMTGVNKRRFLEGIAADAPTYGDWSGNSAWNTRTDGKEDRLFSPFLRKPFGRAVDAGLIPSDLVTMAGTYGAMHDTGDLTYLNLIHIDGVDATSADELCRAEIEGRKQAMHAIEALRRFQPGCEDATLRNFGMTVGVRDSRKIDARYNLTEDDVRGQARFEDSVGIFPEFIDGYGVLVLPTTGRYFHVPYGALVPKGVSNLLVAGRSIGGDKISHAAVRSMMCCTVSGQGAGVGAAVSIREDVPSEDVSIAGVRAELARQGVRLD